MISIGSNNFLALKEIASKFNIQEETLISMFNELRIKYMYLGGEGYVLESEFIKLFKQVEGNDTKTNVQALRKMHPITEREILIETINILRDKKRISIRELREYLKENMNLSEEDLIINKNRNDTRFDQKVRNLVSHRDGNGLLNYCNYENGYLILKED
ncbi:hypothetical protein [Clostridium butyricum]|uniref:hypothetical protein n=1 Tax=Clostridium butyricum TaxID=1492 RepID=UPI0024B38DBA|nr:hypothetical protein [Clostridium butyricum]MDI9210529.1 winged helix-turn-helix domain-containing protein [Clostridium butyricum]